MKAAIIKYNAGNVKSVEFALNKLNVEAYVTDDFAEILMADKVIFPGVGSAAAAMNNLQEAGLDKLIKNLKQPVLGICLGMQIMFEHSAEGNVDCLGIFKGSVKKFESNSLKIPHTGWNNISNMKTDLFKGIEENEYAYFVHSYYAPLSADTICECNYINDFSAAVQKSNFYGIQFHPEKSGKAGLQILENFIKL